MSGIEEIFDGAPTEPEATETPTEETPAEAETKNDVVEELVEGKTPEAKETKEPETPEPTEQELAEAALEETAPKDTVPLAKYMAEKNARRDAEDRATRAEGAVEALKQPAEKKPMSVKDMIDMGRIEPDDAVSAEIWAEIEVNRAEAAQTTSEPKTNRQAFLDKAAESEEQMIAETTVEKVGEGMDYEAVVAAGKGNLSVRDQAEIVRSDDPCRTLYELCIKRTPELKNAVVKEEPTKDTKTAPKKKEPKNAPIPKGTAEQQAASADAEVEFMEAEIAKDDDKQLDEIRELTNAPAG